MQILSLPASSFNKMCESRKAKTPPKRTKTRKESEQEKDVRADTQVRAGLPRTAGPERPDLIKGNLHMSS